MYYPILFEFQHMIVSSFGIFIALALLASIGGLWFFLRYTKNSLLFLQKHFLFLLLSILLFSKLVFIFFTFSEFISNLGYIFVEAFAWESFLRFGNYVTTSGYSFTGGLLGGYLYLFFMCKREGENFFRWLDLFALSLTVGLLVAFVGAFLSGVYYGSPTDLPWAYTFPSSVHSPVFAPVHPLPLYAFVACLFFLFTFSRIFLYSKIPGLTSAVALLLLSPLFFLFEYIRGDAFPTWILTQNQYVLLVFFLLGAGQFFILFRTRLQQ
jgi:prolipoprotein diacylglyceryltransferase